ncbi:MAG: shikimate kinase [Spirochaetes bacterium]|nr:shikimate kinase [Spirochaetota bacterium]
MISSIQLCKPLALLGFMGSGKTEIGKLLAARLGVGFIDLDERIEAFSRAAIPSLFVSLGEPGFRKLESSVLLELSESPKPFILSCGGGVVLLKSNRQLLKECFLSVWIDVPEDELYRRLNSDTGTRPVLGTGDRWTRIHELLGMRKKLYAEPSQVKYVWARGESPEDSAERIRELIDLQVHRLSGTI